MGRYLCPYIRGTNKTYGTDDNGGFWGENGYNCIEVGYLHMSSDGKEILEVIELTPCADVTSLGSLLRGGDIDSLAIDCIGDGYLRLFSRSPKRVKWESETLPLSDMRLIHGDPFDEVYEVEND